MYSSFVFTNWVDPWELLNFLAPALRVSMNIRGVESCRRGRFHAERNWPVERTNEEAVWHSAANDVHSRMALGWVAARRVRRISPRDSRTTQNRRGKRLQEWWGNFVVSWLKTSVRSTRISYNMESLSFHLLRALRMRCIRSSKEHVP